MPEASVTRDRLHTASLTVFAFALRMAWGLATRVPPAWDAELYERGARSFAMGLGYSCFMFGPAADPRVPTAYYPVGYPAYLGALYAIFGVAPWVVSLGGALAGSASVALTHRLALRVASQRAAFVAALALAVMPSQWIFAAAPMTETLWGALLSVATWLLVRGSRWPIVSIAVAAAVYVRPQALVVAAALPFALDLPLRERAKKAAVIIAAALALVAPWTLRNCRAIDGCALVSANGGSNLAVGAMARSDGTYVLLTPDDGCRGVVGEIARERCWRRVAWGRIRERPYEWARRAGPKLHHTFAYEEAPAVYLSVAKPSLFTESQRATLKRVMTFEWMLALGLALLAIAPIYPRRRLGDAARVSLATVLSVAATHAVFFGGDRYHLPLAGPLLVLAATALRDAPRLLRSTGARRLAELSTARG